MLFCQRKIYRIKEEKTWYEHKTEEKLMVAKREYFSTQIASYNVMLNIKKWIFFCNKEKEHARVID